MNQKQVDKRQSGQVGTQQISPLLPAEPAPPRSALPMPENWTTLSLDKSNLPLGSIGGPVLSKIQGDGYTRELVQVRWRASDPIDLYVVRPTGVKNPPVILYLYDFTSDPSRFRDDGWCKRMTKDGFAAVGFVSAISSDRVHAPRPMKQWFVSELQEALASSAHDVQMILNSLEIRGDLDVKNVGMFGQGSGGSIAILAASADPRIKAIDVMDPWGDWPDWLKTSEQIPEEERAQYLTPEFLSSVSNLDPAKLLPLLQTKSVRVEQVLDDAVTTKVPRDMIMAAARKPNEVIRYEDWSALQKAYQTVGLSAWLQSQLRTAAVPAVPHAASSPRSNSNPRCAQIPHARVETSPSTASSRRLSSDLRMGD